MSVVFSYITDNNKKICKSIKYIYIKVYLSYTILRNVYFIYKSGGIYEIKKTMDKFFTF